MSELSIRDKCYVNTNKDTDTFVGIMCDKGSFSVHFPLGFRISESDKDLRNDIMLLIGSIESTIGHRKSGIQIDAENCNQIGFPIQAYLAVIYDFFDRGYYKEREIEYTVAKRGKINWSRTIKTQKPVIQDNNFYYLDFVTRKSAVNENELITMVHEYCVYDSFEKIGWLFTNVMPQKPRIKRNDKLFLSVLTEKLSRTFNDRSKALFNAMIQIVKNLQDEDAELDYKYGTYRYEYVWEALVDRVYGIEGKEAYFPRTTWKIGNRKHDNASLEPDSIMIRGKDIFVLDAKYYKYGATKNLGDLPESTSINKQITYGEYVAQHVPSDVTVYNAFLMPFDSKDKKWQSEEIIFVGEATGDWRLNTQLYEHIQGILVDVKYLMQITVREDSNEIMKLANCIEAHCRVDESMVETN